MTCKFFGNTTTRFYGAPLKYWLIFLAWSSKSYCQRKPGYYSLSSNSGWGRGRQERISTKSALVSQKIKKTIFSHVRYLFLIFLFIFSQHLIHLVCLILIKTAPIRSINSAWRRIRYIWVRMNLSQNSVKPQFGGGDSEGWKTQNLPLFQLINRKLKVVKHQKINPKS